MRRKLLTGFLCTSLAATAQQPLYIPDTLSGNTFSLTMHKDSVQFLPGNKTATMAFNSNAYLGPTLIVQKGTNVNIAVNNQIGDTTNIHWHGLHVAPTNDGPRQNIMPGMSWNPQFPIMNDAATYWYHPHLHMKTALQALRGAAGLIIVRDNAENALPIPRKYGVDDFPIAVQSMQFDPQNQIDERGMEDSILLVNGTLDPYLSAPAQVIRIRLLNASGERNFNFGFTANKSFYVIGNDGGLLSAPVLVTRIRLSPGERAEILLDLTGMNGQTVYLMSYASELPTGVQGGPTMLMPGGPPMNSPLNGIDFNILKLNVVTQTANPITTIPSTLIPQTTLSASQANATRKINFTADNMMVMDGPFYFNDSSYNENRIDYKIPLNNIEIWELDNQTMVAHPFHIHDVQFNILSINGNKPSAKEAGKKDVVMVPPMGTVKFIVKFEDFADSTTPYVYHCHILMHEDDGMMGQFLVMPSGSLDIKNVIAEGGISIYPNPATDRITISVKENNQGELYVIQVKDLLGREIYNMRTKATSITLNTSAWNKGLYVITIAASDKKFSKNVLIE